MIQSFKSILVPVDFSVNTEVAVKKAIELADEGAIIHLLNVQADLLSAMSMSSFRYLMASNNLTNIDLTDERLYQWKTAIEEGYGIRVCTWFCYDGSVQSHIESKAKNLDADLIIIGKSSHHYLLPFLNTVTPSAIAKKTGIPVLTVKPGALLATTKRVVIPVTTESIENKKELIQLLYNKYRLEVYLVSFIENNKPSDFHASSLLNAYQWIKAKLHCSTEYAVLHGHNKARELLKYARKINADILILHPYTETKIGWFNQQITDALPTESKMQILTVQPAI